MSLVKEQWRESSAAQGVAVYSRDLALVKSIANTLKQDAGKGYSRDYIVIHQTSLSSMDNVCVASVLDLDMVGGSIAGVQRGVAKIKHNKPNYPLFLVGDKSDLVHVMQDPEIKKGVARTFAKPMLGPKILTGLNLVLDKPSRVTPVTSSKNSKLSIVLATTLLMATAGGVAWYINGSQILEVSNTAGLSRDIRSEDLTENDVTDIIETVKDAEPSALIDSDLKIETELFNATAQPLLDQARGALKKGYIVGPKKSSALYFYRQVLDIDPYSDQAEKRKQTLLTELKSELSLAMAQAKNGRSNSIIKVITELDPFNSELESIRTAFNERFAKTP